MLCYRDQTFCKSDCQNKLCSALLTDAVRQAAADYGLPVSMMDRSKGCVEYQPKKERK